MNDPRHPLALRVGTRLHWYQLDKVLGQGGFGITYLARDLNLDRPVAIKEYLPIEFAIRDADTSVRPASHGHEETYCWGLERFTQEARILAQFEHDNIVRVFSCFEANGTAYMVMAYEDGQDLEQHLRLNGTLDADAIFALLLPLLDGLESVHKRGFLHRDIKPANIHLRDDGLPVLLDFGAARQALGGQTHTLTQLVSPGYSPIEQYGDDAAGYGPWTDLYGLAATAYRAIAGRPPMDAIARLRAESGNSQDRFVSIVAVGHGRYPDHLLHAIDHALALRDVNRPRSAAAWRSELTGERDSTPVDAQLVHQQRRSGVVPEPQQGFAEAVTEVVEENSGTRRGVIFVLIALVTAMLVWTANEVIIGPPTVRISPPPTNIPRPDSRLQNANKPLTAAQMPESARATATSDAPLAVQQPSPAVENSTIVQESAPASDTNAEQPFTTAALSPRSDTVPSPSHVPSSPTAAIHDRSPELTVNAEAATTVASTQTKIQDLLEAAQDDLDARRLTEPKGRDAWSKYRQVLDLAPDNARAVEGIARIISIYSVLITKAIEAGDLARAEQFLARAEMVSPTARALSPLHERLLQSRAIEPLAAGSPPTADPSKAHHSATFQTLLEQGQQALAAGDRELAIARFEVATELQPDSDIAREHLSAARRIRRAGERFRDLLSSGQHGPELVVIPAGSFTIGTPSEERGREPSEGPRLQVRFAKAFAMTRHEITRGDFARFAQSTNTGAATGGCFYFDDGRWHKGSRLTWRNPGFQQQSTEPVVCVSWNDAVAYARWLSQQSGATYRLASEAEWEYAARAGSSSARFWGGSDDRACAYANVSDRSRRGSFACDDGYAHTSAVGSMKANRFGLHDMLGNAWEWVADCWNASYQGAPTNGTTRAAGDCGKRVIRGGSWRSTPEPVRSGQRGFAARGDRSDDLGFRLVRVLEP